MGLDVEEIPSEQSPRGELNSHALPMGHDRLRVARLPFRHPAMTSRTRQDQQPVRESNPPFLAENQASCPIDERAIRTRKLDRTDQCVGTELNRQSPQAPGLQPGWLAHAKPTHAC
jgi:hypothetical protein